MGRDAQDAGRSGHAGDWDRCLAGGARATEPGQPQGGRPLELYRCRGDPPAAFVLRRVSGGAARAAGREPGAPGSNALPLGTVSGAGGTGADALGRGAATGTGGKEPPGSGSLIVVSGLWHGRERRGCRNIKCLTPTSAFRGQVTCPDTQGIGQRLQVIQGKACGSVLPIPFDLLLWWGRWSPQFFHAHAEGLSQSFGGHGQGLLRFARNAPDGWQGERLGPEQGFPAGKGARGNLLLPDDLLRTADEVLGADATRGHPFREIHRAGGAGLTGRPAFLGWARAAGGFCRSLGEEAFNGGTTHELDPPIQFAGSPGQGAFQELAHLARTDPQEIAGLGDWHRVGNRAAALILVLWGRLVVYCFHWHVAVAWRA